MTPEQRAVMHGPCSSIAKGLHLQVDSDGNVRAWQVNFPKEILGSEPGTWVSTALSNAR